MILVSIPMFLRVPHLLMKTKIKKVCQPSEKFNMAAVRANFDCKITCLCDRNMILVSIPIFLGMIYKMMLTEMWFVSPMSLNQTW